MEFHIENIGEYLKAHEIKPSYQRIKIFQYLVENKNHPTVDMIYKALCTEIPTLSKTTVYNTLNLFIEKQAAFIPLWLEPIDLPRPFLSSPVFWFCRGASS